jgi:hypothetical protein
MKAVAVATDLMMVSRIAAAAERAGVELQRVGSPHELPPPGDIGLVIVDWSERESAWAEALSGWRAASPARVVLFGRHTDLDAHRAAREAGLGPMWARSKLITELDALLTQH